MTQKVAKNHLTFWNILLYLRIAMVLWHYKSALQEFKIDGEPAVPETACLEKTLPCVKAFENEFNIRDSLKKAKEKNEP